MALVLGIEPGRAQAELLREVHGTLGVELVIVSSKDEAIAAIDRQLPDLILVNALLSPREENELVAHLRSLENASHLQLLTIPLLARSSQDVSAKKSSLFGFGKKKRAAAVSDGCDLATFGEQVTTYLARAQEVKSRPGPRVATSVVKAATPAPVEEPTPAYEPPAATAAYDSGETTPIYELPASLYEEPASVPVDEDSLPVPDVDRLFDELGFAPAAEADPQSAIRTPQSAFRTPQSAEPPSADMQSAEVSSPHPGIYDSYLDAPVAAGEPLIVLEDEVPDATESQDSEIEISLSDDDWQVATRTAELGTPSADPGSRVAEVDLARIRAEAEAALAAELDRARSEAAQQRERELAQWQTEAEALREATVGRARAEAEATAREALAEELARARAESDKARQDDLARLQAEAEALREATVGRARAEAEAKAREALAEELARARAESDKARQDDLARLQAEAEALREATVGRARVEAEANAREALAEEVARARAESDKARQEELARLQAEADERLEQVTREAKHVAETEAARAFAEELARVRSASEAAATRALDDEVARVRAEAEARLQAELDRVRREAEEAHRAEHEKAHAEAERIREAAAREAREIAETAAARTLDAEIQRVRAEAEAVRAAAEARLAEQTKAQAEATQAMAEAERIREAAAREAREAAAREARQVAEEAAARRLEAELQRVHAEAEARLKAEREAQINAEKAQEAAAREARAVAEAAAAQALEAEIRRVKADADARLATELDAMRAEAEHRRKLELETMRQQVEEMRLAAAEQARAAAAEAIAAEVARAATMRGTAPAPKTVPVVRVASAKAPATASAPPSAHTSPVPEVVPFESKTPSSSYYDLWRDEGSPSLATGEVAKPQAPRGRNRFGRKPWMVPAAAAALLVVCASIGFSVDALGWAASAKDAIAAALPSAAPTPEPSPSPEAPPTGDLLVETTPKGAEVMVDGKPRGKTPLTVTGLAPGKHKVQLRSSDGVVIERDVLVRVGERAVSSELMVSGWLSVASRLPVDVLVGGRRVGTSGEGQIMLSPGRHKVTFVSRQYNVRETSTVEIRAGSIASHTVKLPSGSLNVDGPDGAEVLVDGSRVGEAPLRGVSVPIGTRDIVIRHPSFGERRETIDIRYGSPATLSVGAAAAPQPGQSFDGLKVLQESAANPGARRKPR